jgi:hypothetical protein
MGVDRGNERSFTQIAMEPPQVKQNIAFSGSALGILPRFGPKERQTSTDRAHGDGFQLYGFGHRRRGAHRRDQDPAGRDSHPRLHAGRHRRTVKAMLPESVRATGADILLGNTYHLMLRPTAERIAALGGLHRS